MAIETIATAGIVKPMLAKAEPSARFRLVCRRLTRAARSAASKTQPKIGAAKDQMGKAGNRDDMQLMIACDIIGRTNLPPAGSVEPALPGHRRSGPLGAEACGERWPALYAAVRATIFHQQGSWNRLCRATGAAAPLGGSGHTKWASVGAI